MIIGIGNDLVEIARIERAYQRYQLRFVERILAEPEQRIFHQTNNKIHYLAKRFAAKEAASKALGTGFRLGISWHDVIIQNDDLNRPYVMFANQAQQRFAAINAKNVFLSMCDEKAYAMASVIIEG